MQEKGSKYRGVTHYKRHGYYEAHVWFQKKQLHIGSYVDEETAALAVDVWARVVQPHRSDFNVDASLSLAKLQELRGGREELDHDELVEALRSWGRESRGTNNSARPLWRPPPKATRGKNGSGTKRRASATDPVPIVSMPSAYTLPFISDQSGLSQLSGLPPLPLVPDFSGLEFGQTAVPPPAMFDPYDDLQLGGNADIEALLSMRRSLTAPGPFIGLKEDGLAAAGEPGDAAAEPGSGACSAFMDLAELFNAAPRPTVSSKVQSAPKKARFSADHISISKLPQLPSIPRWLTSPTLGVDMGGLGVPGSGALSTGGLGTWGEAQEGYQLQLDWEPTISMDGHGLFSGSYQLGGELGTGSGLPGLPSLGLVPEGPAGLISFQGQQLGAPKFKF